MADEFNEIAEINDCDAVFLTDFREIARNSLQIQVAEGLPGGTSKSVKVGETEIPECTSIEITGESRVFEIFWRVYVRYSVLDESYASISGEESFE